MTMEIIQSGISAYSEKEQVAGDFYAHLTEKEFPCIAAHEAASKETLHCMVADHMACPKDDHAIISFLYDFVDEFRSKTSGYHSAAIIFLGPGDADESNFEKLFWQRLQALSDIDAVKYNYDPRVSSDITSPNFSYSLKSEAFYIVGLHPASSRKSRQYKLPVMVFNPHAQFERLRDEDHYRKMQNIVRKRDLSYSGSINPMLADFGDSSEVFQYSGRKYDKDWACPFKPKHADYHTSA